MVEGSRGRVARIERGDRRGHRCERGLRPALPFVQPQPDAEERGRAGERERDTRRLVDPAAVDRQREEEDDAQHDGGAADPRKHAAAEELLEIELRPARRLRRPRRQRRRLRRDRKRLRRRHRRLEPPHATFEILQTSFDRGFHRSLPRS